MRPLRWKSQYRTGNAETDKRKRAFVDCVNKLIEGADQREHCREMEDFIGQLSRDAEDYLKDQSAERDPRHEFGHRLLAALPLSPHGGTACRECGLCDLAMEKIAEHLEAPAQCLFESSGQ